MVKPCYTCGREPRYAGTSYCKECQKSRGQKSYKRNREQVLARVAKYRQTNLETVRAKDRARGYRKPKPDVKKAQCRRYYAKHKEDVRRRQAEAYKLKPEPIRANARRWRKNNPTAVVVLSERRRARERNAPGSFTANEWREIIRAQGGACNMCHRKVKLEIDHIIPLSRGGSNYARNLQGLCRSCNASKSNKLTTAVVAI